MYTRIIKKLISFFRLYVLRDPFLVSAKKWFADKGDESLRFNYQLDSSSIVFDVGGYLGDYADTICKKFGCRVYLFEPVPAFFEKCQDRFKDNSLVTCFNYGLSSSSRWLDINLDNNASSFKITNKGKSTQLAELKSIEDVCKDLNVNTIDLIKINIEGGEFDLLPKMISSGIVKNVRYIQVQFHNFIEDAINNRQLIRQSLQNTHYEMWNYEFVWESWERV